ncbi:Mercaptopyruvate sulfurtransferase/thiosulfate sulfurtransferase, partial [Globisporangium splendens]
MLSPPFSVDHRAASLSDLTGSDGTGGKSSQWLLSPSSTQDRKQQPHLQSATSAASDPKWHPLEFRSISEVGSTSRSLSISVKWDPKQTPRNAEFADTEGSRSVYRIALALTTSWSHVPLVISKSIVTKIAPAAVSATRKFARELETMRMAWWARESFGCEYQLGTWYTADVCVGDPEPPRVLGIEASEAKEEILNDLRDVMVSAVVAGHIKGLLRFERVCELEEVRQQILIMTRGRNVDPLETNDNDGIGHRKSDAAKDCLTFERVSECLQALFESNDENEQALEIVRLQSSTSNPQSLFLRRKARTELLLGIQHGNAVDLSPTAHGHAATTGTVGPLDDGSEIVPQFALWRELHFAHFVTEPSHLASVSSGGETAGFLMLSTAFQIDETAVAALGSPRVHLRSKTAKPVRAQWERRWFVLKRPFLYAYKSFALKGEIGAVDISKCQLLTPTCSNPADHPHPHHSSFSSSSSSSLSQAASSGSSDVLSATSFSFQLVSRAGSKCVVWTLQASTSPEIHTRSHPRHQVAASTNSASRLPIATQASTPTEMTQYTKKHVSSHSAFRRHTSQIYLEHTLLVASVFFPHLVPHCTNKPAKMMIANAMRTTMAPLWHRGSIVNGKLRAALASDHPQIVALSAVSARAFASLVSSEWIQECESFGKKLLVVDCEQPAAFHRAHIPKAKLFGLASSGLKVDPTPNETGVLGESYFLQVLDLLQVEEDATLVFYDDDFGLKSTRMWWVFLHYGFPKEQLKVLNGGWKQWVADAHPVETGDGQDLPVTAPLWNHLEETHALVGLDVVKQGLADGSAQFVDARTPAEHTGQNPNGNARAGTSTHIDAVGPTRGLQRVMFLIAHCSLCFLCVGHVPGAVNFDWINAVDRAQNGRFKSKSELDAVFTDVFKLDKDKPVITYCQRGIRAAHTAFVLSEVLEYPDVKIYENSMLEYLNRADTKVA